MCSKLKYHEKQKILNYGLCCCIRGLCVMLAHSFLMCTSCAALLRAALVAAAAAATFFKVFWSCSSSPTWSESGNCAWIWIQLPLWCWPRSTLSRSSKLAVKQSTRVGFAATKEIYESVLSEIVISINYLDLATPQQKEKYSP